MDYEKEIPFGAFNSELMQQEINIPEGFEANIKGDKIGNYDFIRRKICVVYFDHYNVNY